MSEVKSTFELKYGDPAPIFSLPDAHGKTHSLKDVAGKNGTIVIFTCNHCPYVIHLATEVSALATFAAEQGVTTVAINSNDLEKYPQDGPEPMKEFSAQYSWNFPYLIDESQMVAKSYGAACTPDFFLLGSEGQVVYAGQFDGTRPGSGSPSGEDLTAAIKSLLAGEAPKKGLPSSGCNIKWKPGNEPRYF
ncbi:MAG: thioredoxin family protein [Luteolibacter sp.]